MIDLSLPPNNITRFSALLLLWIMFSISCSHQGVVRDFEGGDFTGFDEEFAKPYSGQVVADPVQAGNLVARFELRHGDPRVRSGNRAEIRETTFMAPFGEELWYRFRTLIPEEWPDQNVRCVIAQWHSVPDWMRGEVWRSPVLAIEYRDKAFVVRICHSNERIQEDNSVRSNNKTRLYKSADLAQKGRWHDFVIQVHWSWESDGYLNVWIDGQQVVSYKGPVGYWDEEGPYFKMGIYRDETHDTFILYHDDYRRGTSAREVGFGDK